MPENDEFEVINEVEFHYHANMVANESLSTLETFDGYTKESKELKAELEEKCMKMLKYSIDYFFSYYEGESDTEESGA